jgi:hypothetical protein
MAFDAPSLDLDALEHVSGGRTSGTYESYTVSVGVGSIGYTRATDEHGNTHDYVTVGGGVSTPGVSVSAGTYESRGSTGDYFEGTGTSVSAGAVEAGWNDSGWNVGLSYGVGAKGLGVSGQDTYTTNLHAPTDTWSPTIEQPVYDAHGHATGFTESVPNPSYDTYADETTHGFGAASHAREAGSHDASTHEESYADETSHGVGAQSHERQDSAPADESRDASAAHGAAEGSHGADDYPDETSHGLGASSGGGSSDVGASDAGSFDAGSGDSGSFE